MSNNPTPEQPKDEIQTPASQGSSHLILLILIAALFVFCIISALINGRNYEKAKNLTEKLASITQEVTEYEAKIAMISQKLNSAEEILQDKEEILEDAEKELQDNKDYLALLEKTTAEMGKRFQIYSARDVKLQGLTFEQPVGVQADKTLVSQIVSSLTTKTPAALKAACEKTLASRMTAARDLSFNPANGCVCDDVAGIVEASAKAAGLKAATRFSWDLDRKTFRVTTTITDSANKKSNAELIFGNKVTTESTYQVSPKSTVFPFTSINLMSNTERVLFERSACIPLGGVYIHYFRVFTKGAWNLEYEFPANLDPDTVNMNLLMLSPGVSASSSIANGRIKFHFAPNSTETTFLLFADKPFFPLRAALQLNQ